MRKKLIYFKNFIFEENGVSSIEYALIASLIAMVIIGSVAVLGDSVQNLYERVSACFADFNSSACTGTE